jgi:CheY-like chemotaxis protein
LAQKNRPGNQDDAPPSSPSLTDEIGAVVHDLRNVLSAIRGFATVVGEDLRHGDQARDDIEQILRAVDRGSELAQRLSALRPSPDGPLTPAGGVPSPVEVDLERSNSWALQQPRRSATVLVVEDDPLVRTMIVRVLRRNGYATLEAASAAESEERALEQGAPVELVLIDVGLPHTGGPELAERLRQRWPLCKVLFTSGFGRTALAERGVRLGPSFLEKPFAPITLLERVEALLAPGSS